MTPHVTTSVKPSGVVTLVWKKGRRGPETQFTFLERDIQSPYVDTRANASIGVPELRTYRLRYEMNGAAVGVFCDDVKVSTLV